MTRGRRAFALLGTACISVGCGLIAGLEDHSPFPSDAGTPDAPTSTADAPGSDGSMPPPPNDGGGVRETGGTFYVVGGDLFEEDYAFEVHSIHIDASGKAGAWHDATSAPLALGRHAVFAVGSTVTIAGGRERLLDGGHRTSQGVLRGRVSTTDGGVIEWADAGPLPVAAAFMTGVASTSRGLLAGGQLGRRTLYTDLVDAGPTTWNDGGALPDDRVGAMVVAIGNDVYLAGGELDGGTGGTDVFKSSFAAGSVVGSWTATTPLPARSSGRPSLAFNGRILLLGDPQTGATDSAVGTPASDGGVEWTQTKTYLHPRVGACAAVIGRTLAVFGGSNGSDKELELARLHDDGTVDGDWYDGPDSLVSPLIGSACFVVLDP